MQGDLSFPCPPHSASQAVQLHLDDLHQGPVGLCGARPPFHYLLPMSLTASHITLQ